MKRTLATALGLLAAATFGFAAEKPAADKATPKAAEAKPAAPTDVKEAASKPLPFVGKATAVDAAAKTFSLNGKGKDRVFATDEATKITKEGKPATLADITVGDEVTGSYVKAGEVQTAKSVKVGGKPKAVAAVATPAAPADPTAPKAGATPAAKPAPVKKP